MDEQGSGEPPDLVPIYLQGCESPSLVRRQLDTKNDIPVPRILRENANSQL